MSCPPPQGPTLKSLDTRVSALETALLQEQQRTLQLVRILSTQQEVLRQVLHQLTEDALTNDGAQRYEGLQANFATFTHVQRLLGTTPAKESTCSAST